MFKQEAVSIVGQNIRNILISLIGINYKTFFFFHYLNVRKNKNKILV